MSAPTPVNRWLAQWIWTAGPLVEPFHVALFRGRCQVARGGRARLRIAADSRYRLWLDGELLGDGPARGHAAHPYYDTWEVKLAAGEHVLAVQVQHYTAKSSIFAPVRGGLLCQVELGRTILAPTGAAWRACDTRGYSVLPGMLMPTRCDARRDPADWHLPGFADSAWAPATVLTDSPLAPPADLLPRPIPRLTNTRLVPTRVLGCGACQDDAEPDLANQTDIATSLWRSKLLPAAAGAVPDLPPLAPWTGAPLAFRLAPRAAAYLMVDFGRETLAVPALHLRGPAGLLADLGYSETLWNNRVATRWQTLRQSERIVTRAGETALRLLQPRGFRYLMLRLANPTDQPVALTLHDLAAYEQLYPTQPRGQFAASDPLLGAIYQLAARTVNLCMEDAYTDCPWRERSQWVGDAQPETLFSYYCFGAYDLARKAVLEFTSGNTAEGWIPGVFPISRPFNLPTWGMRVPVIAWEYVLYSGDRSVLPQVWEGVRRQMDYFARHEDADGLVVGMQGWNFVDWTRVDDRHADGAVQGWYLEALEFSARLAAEVGADDAATDLRRRAARLRASLARLYWSPARKAFRKYRPGSPEMLPGTDPELIAQHENFLFSLLGVGTAAQRRQALAAVSGQTGRFLPNLGDYQSAFYPAERRYHHNQEPAGTDFQAPGESMGNYLGEDLLKLGSPFWSYYALLALHEAGLPAAALEYQRLGWGLMLEHGATSCWEMWDRHTSLCHGWSAAPAMILPAYTLGVLPLTPGFARFRVAPRFADLTWARGTVPTPHGPIACTWRRRGDTVTLRLTVPAGTRAEVDAAPPGQPGWRIATRQVARRTASLPPGRHTLTLRAPAAG